MSLTGPKKDVGCVTESFYSTTFDRQSPGKTRKTVYTQRFVLKIPNFKRHSSVQTVLNQSVAFHMFSMIRMLHHMYESSIMSLDPTLICGFLCQVVAGQINSILFVLGLIKFVFVPMIQCGATQLEAGLKTCLDMYIYIYLTHVHHKLQLAQLRAD